MTTIEELEEKLANIELQIAECYVEMQSLDYKDCDNIRERLYAFQDAERNCKFAIRIEKASDLEKQFLETYQTTTNEISDLIGKASAALHAAEKLADERGIPFSSHVVFNGDTYIPATLGKKWSDVSTELLDEIFDEDELSRGRYFSSRGWLTSYC